MPAKIAGEIPCGHCPDGISILWLPPSVSGEVYAFARDKWIYRCDICGMKSTGASPPNSKNDNAEIGQRLARRLPESTPV